MDDTLTVTYPGPAVDHDTGRSPAHLLRLDVTLVPGLNVLPAALARQLAANGTVTLSSGASSPITTTAPPVATFDDDIQ